MTGDELGYHREERASESPALPDREREIRGKQEVTDEALDVSEPRAQERDGE